MLNPQRFKQVAVQSAFLRCLECGAVLDASEEARGLHVAWHETLQAPQDVLDLTETADMQGRRSASVG